MLNLSSLATFIIEVESYFSSKIVILVKNCRLLQNFVCQVCHIDIFQGSFRSYNAKSSWKFRKSWGEIHFLSKMSFSILKNLIHKVCVNQIGISLTEGFFYSDHVIFFFSLWIADNMNIFVTSVMVLFSGF